ncbi:MAG: glycosyltransferase, partial [Bacteroidota bacterium]
KTLDYMDALSKGVERRIAHAPAILKPLLQLEAARLARYEAEVFAAFEHKAIISQQDRALIDHGQRDAIAVIPNGVDPLFFESLHQEKEYEVLFTGNMSYPPNVDSACYLVRDIMPLVWREHPEARVLISGANPAGKVRALAGAKVTVTGWVEDIRHSYARSQIFAAPMQIGTGLQNKLLEAMAMQLPCVTSPLANNALGAAPDAEILIGTDTASFASAIVALLDNTILYDRIAAAGHSYVRARFDWDKTTDQLEQLMVTPSTA